MVSKQVWRAIKAKSNGFPNVHLSLVVQEAKNIQEHSYLNHYCLFCCLENTLVLFYKQPQKSLVQHSGKLSNLASLLQKIKQHQKMLKQLETSFLFRKIKQLPKSSQKERVHIQCKVLNFLFDCTLFRIQVMDQIRAKNNKQICSFFEK